jgi:UDP-N-acetylmuramyl pentapeptide phosphotransferase/UDP-N-acetylglucosamine-1-phosphate transferase
VAAVPFAVSLAAAAALAPGVLSVLRRSGRVRPNFRGSPLPAPTGIVLVAGAVGALALLSLTSSLGAPPAPVPSFSFLFVLGVAVLGLLDDVLGARAGVPRGLRGHGRELVSGHLTTGTVKAVGTAVLAALALYGHDLPLGEHLLGVCVLTLAAHAFNLLDLRPGRSIKALVALGAALTLGSRDLAPLATLGVFLGPVFVLLPIDLRERGMLGDTGASAIGAVAGLWLVIALPAAGEAVALVALAAVAAYGELRSITALLERVPLLRQLDSFGRCG